MLLFLQSLSKELKDDVDTDEKMDTDEKKPVIDKSLVQITASKAEVRSVNH